MKRIAIFFDGTANRSDADFQTNVVLLSRCVAARGHKDVTQLVQYYPGVGSGRGVTRLAKWLDRTLGGALAFGLIDIVEEAYRALVFAYEPGDEVYIFGFSRGAFTARVFAGLLRSCGIPPQRNLRDIPTAIARHLSKAGETDPDHPDSIAFRAGFAPETATSPEDLAARRDRSILLTVRYMGLWDTVKSFAVAQSAVGDTIRTPAKFHDLKLSGMVESVRHAMSVDERRRLYSCVPFTNLDDLNAWRAVAGPPPYQQQWFAGNHPSVGGGGNRIALSSMTLRWVGTGAVLADLRLLQSEVNSLAWHMDPCGPLQNRLDSVTLIQSLLAAFTAARFGPCAPLDMSVAALDRCLTDPAYRPKALRKVLAKLDELDPSAKDALRQAMVARDGGLTHSPLSRYWIPPDGVDQTS